MASLGAIMPALRRRCRAHRGLPAVAPNSPARCLLLGADALLADDAAPALMLGAHERAELGRRAADGLRAERSEALAHIRLAQHLSDLRLQPRQNPGWRAGDGEESLPADH